MEYKEKELTNPIKECLFILEDLFIDQIGDKLIRLVV